MSRTVLERLDDAIATIRNENVKYCLQGGYNFTVSCIDRVGRAFATASAGLRAAGRTISLWWRQALALPVYWHQCVREFFFPTPEGKRELKLFQLLQAKTEQEKGAILSVGSGASDLSVSELEKLFHAYIEQPSMLPSDRGPCRKHIERLAKAETLEEIEEIESACSLSRRQKKIIEPFASALKKPHQDLRARFAWMRDDLYRMEQNGLEKLVQDLNALKDPLLRKKVLVWGEENLKNHSEVQRKVLQRANDEEKRSLRKRATYVQSWIKELENDELLSTQEFSLLVGGNPQSLDKNDLQEYLNSEISNNSSSLGELREMMEQYRQQREEWREEERHQIAGHFQNNANYLLPKKILEKNFPYANAILSGRQEYENAQVDYKEECLRKIKKDQKFSSDKIHEAHRELRDALCKGSEDAIQQQEKLIALKNGEKGREPTLPRIPSLPLRDAVEEDLVEAARRFFDAVRQNPDDPKQEEALHQWDCDLQRIWMDHLSSKQEKAMRAIKDPTQRCQRMADAFADWILEATGVAHRIAPEKFASLSIKDRTEETNQALQTIQKHLKGPLLKYLEKKKGRKNLVESKPIVKKVSFPIADNASLEISLPGSDTFVSLNNVESGRRNLLRQLENYVSRFVNASTPKAKIKALQELADDHSLDALYEKKGYLWTLCKELVASYQQDRLIVPLPLQRVIASLFDPNHKRNELFFTLFLEMVFSQFYDGQGVRVTSAEYRYLTQMNALSASSRVLNLEVDEKNSALQGFLVEEMGERVQQSFLGLEGLDESTLQQTFAENGSKNDFKSSEERKVLDALRARGEGSLRHRLLGYVEKIPYLAPHDKKEMERRAIFAAALEDQEAVIQWLKDKITSSGGLQQYFANEASLAPMDAWFYYDCLCEIDPTVDLNNPPWKAVNQALIDSREIHQMLLGFSREVVRLTKLCAQDNTQERYYELLKNKMAYQALHHEHFFNQREIKGFLKNSIDAMEKALLETPPYDEDWGALDTSLDSTFSPQFLRLTEKDLYLKGKLAQWSNIESVSSWKLDSMDNRPKDRIVFGPTQHLSLRSGIVYTNGEQCEGLPVDLSHDPIVRQLQLHKLPFHREGDVYVNYAIPLSQEEPAQAQLKIASLIDSESPIIQQQLQTDFVREEKQWLQFVPEQKLETLSKALLLRMGIVQCWMDVRGSFYGYDEAGHLVARWKVREKMGEAVSLEIETYDGKQFSFPTVPDALQPFYKKLCQVVPASEILCRKPLDNSASLWVPGLGMTFVPQGDLPEIRWVCHREGMPEMIVDEQGLDKGYLHAILQEDPRVKKAEKEEDRLLILENRLMRNGEKIDRSLNVEEEKKALKGKIARQKEVLEKLRGSLCIVVPANEDFKRAPLDTIPFTLSYDGALAPQNLAGVLYLMKTQDDLDASWVEKLAQYPLLRPLDPISLELLNAVLGTITSPALRLYCLAMLRHHALLKSAAIIRLPSGGSEKEMKAINEEIEACEAKINEQFNEETLKQELEGSLRTQQIVLEQLPKEFRDQWLIVPTARESREGFSLQPSLSLAREIDRFAQRSLLDRLHLQNSVQAVGKSKEGFLSEGQRAFIQQFKTHSPEQVEGFYLEELGIFHKSSLFAEFQFPQKEALDSDQGLFGLQRAQMQDLLDLLVKEGALVANHRTLSYCVGTRRHPLAEREMKDVEIYLRSQGFSEQKRAAIMQKLRVFLARAAQAGFTFSLTQGSEATVQEALQQEKGRHREAMLEAQDFLRTHLPKEMSWDQALVELKAAMLTGTGREQFHEFVFLQNALIRYLVHKTELKHIENIENAPLTGERSKPELLALKRQYRTDFLLNNPNTDEELEEQLLQRAFLLFEEDYGHRCSAMQYALFRSLLLDSSSEESVDAIQARMGFGKTALLPIMALMRIARNQWAWDENKRYLPLYIVPKAVIEDNTKAFHTRLANILGSRIVQDREFVRYQINREEAGLSFALIEKDLRNRLDFYRQAQANGSVLIQWPEIRGCLEAQELEFGRILTERNIDGNVRNQCLRCKWLLGQMRAMQTYAVFDELDDTQDFKSRKVNYTCGDKQAMPLSSILHLEQILSRIQGTPEISAEELYNALGLPGDQKEDILKFLADASIGSGSCGAFQDLEEEEQEKVLLMRALLQDPHMLALATSKQPNTHFGVRSWIRGEKKMYSFDPESNAPLLIAVPYEGTNTPKGLSIYDNTEVTAIATMRYYNSSETLFDKEPHLAFLLAQVQRNGFAREVTKLAPGGCMEALECMQGLLGAARRKAEEEFYQTYMKNPTATFRVFFGVSVCAAQIRSNTHSTKSDRYEMGSPYNLVKGCSGTIGGTSSYFKRQKNDPAADGRLSLEIFGRDANQKTALLEAVDESGDFLQETLSGLLRHARSYTRAIIDAAGICKSKDGLPETVVRELWRQLQSPNSMVKKIQGIIYYDKQGMKRLFKGFGSGDLCTTEIELEAIRSGIAYFSFYGQKNTRGSDIKQADGAHALVTFDENVSNSDAKQAALRFRSLVHRSSGQSISFALTPSVQNILRTRAKDEEDPFSARRIALYLRDKERDAEELDALTIFRQEMQAHVKQAAAHLEHLMFAEEKFNSDVYMDFLRQRNQIIAFADSSILDLLHKYGQGSQEVLMAQFVLEQRAVVENKLRRLKNLCSEKVVSAVAGIYKERIQETVAQFCLRYSKDKVSVSDADQDTDAVVVSEALAEALAEAQVESTTLTENMVDVEEGQSLPQYIMTHRLYHPVSLGFLSDPNQRVSVEALSWIAHTIPKHRRQEFFCSPGLQKSGITSHFVLQNTRENLCYFITQEEAALFVQSRGVNGWTLYDLRQKDALQGDDNAHRDLQIAASAILQWDVLPEQRAWPQDVLSLRNLSLVNAQENRELHPRLTITHARQKLLRDDFDYGVSRKGEFASRVDWKEKQWQITVGSSVYQVSLDSMAKNPAVLEFVQKFWNSNPVERRVEHALRALEQEEKKLLSQVQGLEKLEKVQSQLIEKISRIKGFQLSEESLKTMQNGLETRDRNAQNFRQHPLQERFMQCITQIQSAQKKEELKDYASLLKLREQLYQLFSQAVIDYVEKNGIDPATTSIFSPERIEQYKNEGFFGGWQDFYQKPSHATELYETVANKKPIGELVYGRILYSVHGGFPSSAEGCPLQDCKQMFRVFLPQFLYAAKEISQGILEAKKIQDQIDQLKSNPALQRLTWVREALVFFDTLQRQQEAIEGALKEQGLLLKPETFFDLFVLNPQALQQGLRNAQGSSFTETVQWDLPEYCDLQGDWKEYQKRIPLTKEERACDQKQGQFHQRLLQLARAIEPRQEETRISVKN